MNFSPVISWARSTSYDVVGIFIPGIVMVSLCSLFLFDLPGVSIALGTIIKGGSLDQQNIGSQGHILAIVLLAYLIGFIIKSMGDAATRTESARKLYHRKFYILGAVAEREDFSSAGKEMLPVAARSINRYLSKHGENIQYVPTEGEIWPRFYKFSQSILEINQYPTKAVTYQNRYELFKSLSIVFILFAIVAVVNIAATLLLAVVNPSLAMLNDFVVAIFVFLFLFFLSVQCRDLYLKHWRNLGDTLITSIIVVLEQIDTNKPHPSDDAS